jgi:predicted AAA+ superfamily ATPase
MIRYKFLQLIEKHFKIHKVCALLGPRQSGKTTLSNDFIKLKNIPSINVFDLENYSDVERLRDPLLSLSELEGFIIIDEIQYVPNLFSTIRVLVDKKNIKFLVLGSASRDLIKQSSETLAGRIGYIEVTPFALSEITEIDNLWLRGGFPSSYLAAENNESSLWRQNYIKTFLERDIPNLGFSIPAVQLRRFWMMICNYHGNIFNALELGNSLGISSHTVKHYLDILEGTFMIRVLRPWHENLQKRQVKTPKIFFRDSGIYHTLLGLDSYNSIKLNPKLGASWEGFALEQVIKYYNAEPEECYFWSSHNTAEIDLLIFKDGKRLGFEFKYSSTPRITRSTEIALRDLKLDQVNIIFPSDKTYTLSEKINAIGLKLIHKSARKEAIDIELFSPIIINTYEKIGSTLELEEFAKYFSDNQIDIEDKAYIEKCITDFGLGKELYKEKKIIDRGSWKINCILISHEPNSPFYRDLLRKNEDQKRSFPPIVDEFLHENNIDNNEVEYGIAIIFQDNTNLQGQRVGINISVEITLKNEKKLKKEWSFNLKIF